ncbi:MAG: SAM-dependent chlorinase/fluorinase [Planctomycetia bacterium]|nr:SAM-dependent chlorinase/fluorinase [Planctomycetia bacterium]
MANRIITLTTDFGTASPYVAAMKGVILSRCSDVQMVDLSHDIPSQNVQHGAYFLRDALPWFPPETIHIVVIDPGVGTSRKALCFQINQHYLLCPDNGLATLLPQPKEVRELSNREHWLPQVSSTFHGRDIFAPCAAALASGLPVQSLGPVITNWQTLPIRQVRKTGSGLEGEIVFIDAFGNLISNIAISDLPSSPMEVRLGSYSISSLKKTYGEAAPGEAIALVSSSGFLEIAVVNGNAAEFLQAGLGTPLEIQSHTIVKL